MANKKIYKCCICNKVLTDSKPIRLVKQIYGAGKYQQYANVCNYDFCDDCYGMFDKWIKKYKKDEGDGR